MKNKTKKRLVVMAAVIMTLSFTACSDGNSSAKSPEISDVKIQKDVFKGVEETCTYADSEHVIFSAGKSNDRQTGPTVDTRFLYNYSFSTEEGNKVEYKTDAYIYNTVAFDDGILFATYDESGTLCKWKVCYAKDDKVTVLDEGLCSGYDFIPDFVLAGEDAFYLTNNIKGDSITQELKKVTKENLKNKEAEPIFKEATKKSFAPQIYSNGKQYCFLAGDGKYAKYYIGDSKGITFEGKLDEKVTSFGINDEYMLIGTVKEGKDEASDQPRINAINLSTGENNKQDVKTACYRLCGSGKEAVCVDSEFNSYSIAVSEEKIDMEEVKVIAESDYAKMPVMFHSMGEGAFFMDIAGNDKENLYAKLKL